MIAGAWNNSTWGNGQSTVTDFWPITYNLEWISALWGFSMYTMAMVFPTRFAWEMIFNIGSKFYVFTELLLMGFNYTSDHEEPNDSDSQTYSIMLMHFSAFIYAAVTFIPIQEKYSYLRFSDYLPGFRTKDEDYVEDYVADCDPRYEECAECDPHYEDCHTEQYY